MTQGKRKVFFLAAVTIFVIATSLVLLFASGFRLTVRKGQLHATGVLNVTSLPRRALITVDGRPTRRQTPARITLVPGDHTVTLERNGYLPWSKTVSVYPRGSTFLQNVSLIRKSSPALLATSEEFAAFALAPSKRTLAFVAKEKGSYRLQRFDLRSGRGESIATIAEKPQAITWSPSEQHLLVEPVSLEHGQWMIVNVAERSVAPISLPVGTLQRVQWSENDGEVLSLVDHRLLQLRPGAGGWEPVPELAGTRVKEFLVRDQSLIVLTVTENDQPSELQELQRRAGNRTVIAALPYGDVHLLPSEKSFIVIDERRGHTTLYARQGSLTLATDFPFAATNVQFAPSGQDILFSTQTDLWLIQGGHQKLLGRYAEGVGTSALDERHQAILIQAGTISVIDSVHDVTTKVPVALDGQTPVPVTLVTFLQSNGELFAVAPAEGGTALFRLKLR